MITAFKKTLKLLNFKPAKGGDSLQKEYPRGQVVTVNFDRQKIDYGNKIQIGERSVTNFSQKENLVVLECVDRLLMKGYQPEHILLQKRWKLGRTGKSGIGDIVVRGRNEPTLLIIECKTWGVEFKKEKTKILRDGGQLFSYFQQDKGAAFLCLYASQAEQEKIEWQNVLVDVRDNDEHRKREDKNGKHFAYRSANDVPGLVEVWENRCGKQFLSSGIFESGIEAYSPGFEPIKIGELREFSDQDRGKVYKEFEEILRHNNISDRSNAFNRVISLILSKIVDEEKAADMPAGFQILEGDIPETAQERLETLYSKAMREYLKEDVVNHTEGDIEEIVSHFPRQAAQKQIRTVLRELKFYKNNEFAFKEVYNERLFRENAKVLFEVVRLFSPYRFRYERKAQFLGDFFELMLESGYKQTEGQFFTPTPIARFIVSSLPLRKIIENKLRRGEPDFLPYVVDYACGSGHFLTESIEKIQNIIERDVADIFAGLSDGQSGQLEANFADYQKSTHWAGNYIFGIEKDYRLARTSQVSCFMHGDGDANIIFGDGLIHYENKPGNRLPKDRFDVLVANPPYSIKDFVSHLREVTKDDYELMSHISASSDDIEVLFLERAAQLLRTDGVAGIFMPSSILANSGVYRHARELMLRYFEITAIAELGGETFAKTGTNTIILFLRRRKDEFEKNCRCIAEDFIRDGISRPDDFADSEAVFAAYTAHRGVNLADYRTFVAREPGESILQSVFYKSLREKFESSKELKSLKRRVSFRQASAAERKREVEDVFFDWALAQETEKFFAYLLCHRLIDSGDGKRMFAPQETLIIKSGTTATERKNFLGYSFSERRGYKGIKLKTDENGKHLTKLYDADGDDNPHKINSHIRRAFLKEKVGVIDSELAENLHAVRLYEMMDFEATDFESRINLQANKQMEMQSKWPTVFKKETNMVELGAVAEIYGGGTPRTSNKAYWDGDINWATLVDTKVKHLRDTVRKITELGMKNSNAMLLPINTVLFSSRATIGDVCIAKVETCTNQGYKNFVCDEAKLDCEYLYYILHHEAQNIATLGTGMTYPEVSREKIAAYKIPLPPIDVQREIAAELGVIDVDAEKYRSEIVRLRAEIDSIINGFDSEATMGDACSLSREKTEPRKTPDEIFSYIGLEHIESNTGNLVEAAKMPGAQLKSAKNVFAEGDLLYGKLRPYLNKAHIADFDGVCSTDIIVLKTEIPLIIKYILLGEDFVRRASTQMKGMNLPRIGVTDFLNLKIKLPPPRDRRVAVEKIRRLDTNIKAAQAQIAQAQPKKKAVLEKRL